MKGGKRQTERTEESVKQGEEIQTAFQFHKFMTRRSFSGSLFDGLTGVNKMAWKYREKRERRVIAYQTDGKSGVVTWF